jgi:signal transduction histidine kinase
LGHRIELEAPEELPVRGDRDRIAQVFGNLLGNAVKYSPGGGIVHVAAEVTDGVVRVGVRDEGIGVPEEHKSRIFTKFFRGNAQESGIAGTGLGLAVSREIVEGHGGRVGFESRESEGSEFWFELPIAVTAAGPARQIAVTSPLS